MVDVERNGQGRGWRFVLQPNRSLSWRGSVLFFFSLCLVSGAIAAGFSLLGFWMILPFAGLEMLALGAGLYVVARRCYEREVICIGGESIHVERGGACPRQCWTLARRWARVVLEQCPGGWYSSRLLLCSRDRAVEIGRFLHEDERRRLAADLAAALRSGG